MTYSNSFGGPFLFDDLGSIVNNPTIRHLGDLGSLLSPPPGETVGGRPLLNLTFALNYAFGGVSVWGYHLVNLLIHLCAGLTLFGVVRRTLLFPTGAGTPIAHPLRHDALCIATLSALLFLVHPLQTESVTYIVQRAEALVSLWYLLTLYAFIRSVDGSAGRYWATLAVICCALGMASKEVMVGAPLVVLLYDRTFVSGNFADAWRARRNWYVALAATWIILGYLIFANGRGESAGLTVGLSPWTYLLTQVHALVHYFKLVWWPVPLVFDYGTGVETSFREVFGWVLVIAAVKLTILWGLYRRYALGFLGAAALLILAPSSSVVPVVTQTIAEHRMYLALGSVLVAGVLVLYRLVGRWAIAICLIWAAILSGLTIERNRDYASEETLWENTIAFRPTNPRAHRNLALLQIAAGDSQSAMTHLRQAVALDSTYAMAQLDLGRLLGKQRKFAEAKVHFAAAVRLKPEMVEARFNYASMLAATGEIDSALAEYREVAHRDSTFPRLQLSIGQVLAGAGRFGEAAVVFRGLAQAMPDSLDYSMALGTLLILSEEWPDAVVTLQGVVQQAPGLATAHNALGKAYAGAGRRTEAASEFNTALALNPALAEAKEGLARLGGKH